MSEQSPDLPIVATSQPPLSLIGGLVAICILIMMVATMVFGHRAPQAGEAAPLAAAKAEAAAVVQPEAVSGVDVAQRIKPVGEVNLAQAEVPAPPPAPAAQPAEPVAKPAEAKQAVAAPATPAVPAAKPEAPVPAPVAAAQPPKPEASTSDEQHNIQQAIQAWAAAWSQQNIDDYLACYAKDFKAQDGKSRPEWEAARRERIAKAKSISVVVENLQATLLDAAHAKVTIRQVYRSDALQDVTNKALLMVKSNNRWLIQEEKAGS